MKPIKEKRLIELFNSCTVKVTSGARHGTGFFIYKNHILTCAHLLSNNDNTSIIYLGNKYDCNIIFRKEEPYPDFAILRVIGIEEHPVVYLGEEDIEIEDSLYCYSHLKEDLDNPHSYSNESAQFVFEGISKKGEKSFLKLKSSQAISGMSGSPLLNLRSGKVCGILARTRDENSDLGGRAIPINVILSEYPELRNEQKNYHQINSKWIEFIDDLIGDTAFKNKINNALIERNYKVSKNIILEGVEFEIYAILENGFTRDYIVALPIKNSNAIDNAKVDTFHKDIVYINTKRIYKVRGVIFAESTIKESVLTYATSFGISCISMSIYYRPSFDSSSIAAYMVKQYNENELRNVYIDLNCNVQESEVGGTIYKPVDKYLDNFFISTNKSGITIFGNFGTGKSSFCKQYAYKIATRWFNDPSQEFLPMYFNLRDFNSFTEIEEEMLQIIKYDYNIQADKNGLLNWLFKEKSLVILDGFDEMANKLSKNDTNKSISFLDRFCKKYTKAKIILTCRTHFFRDRVDEQSLGSFLKLYILDWGKKEIEDFISKSNPSNAKESLEVIEKTYNLEELAKTPIFAKMISKTLSSMPSSADKAKLYENYTKQWIESENQRAKELGPIERQIFMEDLAFYMYKNDQPRVAHTDLRKLIDQLLKINDYNTLNDIESDVRTCTFLVRSPEGIYYFSHRSFMEYFIASKLSKESKSNEFSSLDAIIINKEIASFISDYFRDEIDFLKRTLVRNENSNRTLNIIEILGTFKYEAIILQAILYIIDISDEFEIKEKAIKVVASYGDEQYVKELYKLADVNTEFGLFCLGQLSEYLNKKEVAEFIINFAIDINNINGCVTTWGFIIENRSSAFSHVDILKSALLAIFEATNNFSKYPEVSYICIQAAFEFKFIDLINEIFKLKSELPKNCRSLLYKNLDKFEYMFRDLLIREIKNMQKENLNPEVISKKIYSKFSAFVDKGSIEQELNILKK